MKLILDAEIAALPFAVLLLVYHGLFYKDSSTVNKRFRSLIIMCIMCIITDTITGYMINIADRIPFMVNQIANSVYYMFCGAGIYCGFTYIDAVIEERTGKKKGVSVDIFLLILYIIIMTVNIFTGLLFYFDETGYVHAVFYPVGPFFIMFMALIFITRISLNTKKLRMRSVSVIYACYIILVMETIDQVFFSPEVLRAGLCSTIAIMALLFSMETPEYTKLIDLKKNYNEKLERESEIQTRLALEAQNGIIMGMADLLEDRDPQTGGHVERSSHVVLLMTQKMHADPLWGAKQGLLESIVKAAPLHDLGKLNTKSRVLQKDGKYSEQEYTIMKEHVLAGGDILRQVMKDCPDKELVNAAINMTLYHHERYDGSGYPEGLAGDAIPLEARVMAVADVFDALVTKRSYKSESTFDEAMKIMESNFGTMFDPQLKQYFLDCSMQLKQYYTGRDLA